MSRADRYSLEAKKVEVYSDFMNNFDLNPITGLLARVTNEQSIGQALRNITLTMRGERFYAYNKGSDIEKSMFELMGDVEFELLKMRLRELYRAYEPRAIIHDIRVDGRQDENALNVTVVYSSINIPDEYYTVSFAIKQVR